MGIRVNIGQLIDPDLFVDDGIPPVTTPPTITLSSPQSGIYEPGQNVGPVTLNAVTTAGTGAPITDVTFSQGGFPINSVPSPQPNGGNEQYIDPTIYTSNATFTATVTSGSGTGTSNSVTIRYQNRIYRGFNSATSIGEAEIEGLNYTVLQNNYPGTYEFTDNILSHYKYICYPTALGDLDLTPGPNYAIKDSGGFPIPVIKQTNVTLTNAFGASIEYNVYRSSNILGGIATWTVI